MMTLPREFDEDGCAIVPRGVDLSACKAVIDALNRLPRDNSRGGVRHALKVPEIAALANHPSIRDPIRALMGPRAFAFKATYFEKSPDANWFVGWHQDIVIPVACALDVPGFSHWTEKAGVPHTQPPHEVLESIIAVRVNLDASTPENGALEVLPGSHKSGILNGAQIAASIRELKPVSCLTPPGGLIFMRPLLLHASTRMSTFGTRRVIHFEFTGIDLPNGLEWHRRIPFEYEV